MARKLVEFHREDRLRLDELVEDRSTSFQELMDEAVRDLLLKRRKYTDLKTALKKSAEVVESPKKTQKKPEKTPQRMGAAPESKSSGKFTLKSKKEKKKKY